MAKATAQKTKKTKASVRSYIASIDDLERRNDAVALIRIIEDITGKKPAMWGPSIIGFGQYHYKYESGHEGDAPVTGFSSRKQALTIYIMPGYRDMSAYLAKLGPHKIGKSCLYIKRLSDIHIPTLKKMIADGVRYMRKNYETS